MQVMMQKTHETATGAGSFTAVPLPEFRSKDAEASRGTTAADATARDSNTEKRVFVGSILSVVFGVDVGGTEREVGGIYSVLTSKTNNPTGLLDPMLN